MSCHFINKEVLKENVKNKYRNLSEEKKMKKENMNEIDIETWQRIKKDKLKEYQNE